MPGWVWKDAMGWHLPTSVTGVTGDSRQVQPGNIFVAIAGARSDGHAFIEEAVRRGAVAVVGEKSLDALSVPYIQVPSSRQSIADIAATFYRFPSQRLTVVGVTGTNGKTSVVYWLTDLLRKLGNRTGMVSSIVNDTGAVSVPSRMTTPEGPELQNLLFQMEQAACTHAVCEVSSHAIAQGRIGGTRFAVAVLTNITREHLDYHGSMEAYVDTKSRLFEELSDDARGAVLNADDPSYPIIASRITRVPVISYGTQQGDLRAEHILLSASGSQFQVVGGDRALTVQIRHPGRHNVYNVLAVMSAGMALGIDLADIVPHLRDLPHVPGRMELVASVDGVSILVDYAHTPDGLQNALNTVRTMARGRVWLLFGARGERDRGKRPQMGRVASWGADMVILTTDSPGTEDPGHIAQEILAGADGPAQAKVVLDRESAIRSAVWEAKPGDVVLITGRGPESYQIFGSQRRHLLDAEVCRAAVREREARAVKPRPSDGSWPLSPP